jgi:hypothetical protein
MDALTVLRAKKHDLFQSKREISKQQETRCANPPYRARQVVCRLIGLDLPARNDRRRLARYELRRLSMAIITTRDFGPETSGHGFSYLRRPRKQEVHAVRLLP